MKHMSKIFALALALVMMLSLATTASAYTISMAPSDSGAGVAGHTSEVYQIYTGTMAEIDGEETLGELFWFFLLSAAISPRLPDTQPACRPGCDTGRQALAQLLGLL